MDNVLGGLGALALLGVLFVGGLFALLFIYVAIKRCVRIPKPSEVFVISGSGAKLPSDIRAQLEEDARLEAVAKSEKTGQTARPRPIPEFKLVKGKSVFVRPLVQRVTSVSLVAEEAQLPVNSPTHQGIELQVQAVVSYRVGDDYLSAARAATQFESRDEMVKIIKSVLEGHLRAVIGTMTVEEILRDRQALIERVQEACSADMEQFGLVINTFGIQQFSEGDGYIDNLGAPEKSRVQKEADIARANNEREAAERVAEAKAAQAKAEAQSRIQQAEALAVAQQAEATAAQAGPLAAAKAQEAVVQQNTRIAELDAARVEKELESSVKRPAEAEAFRQTTLAEAAKQTAILEAQANAAVARETGAAQAEVALQTGEAQAEAEKKRGLAKAEIAREQGLAEAKVVEEQGLAQARVVRESGLAEAEGIAARADALAKNQEAVIQQELVRQLTPMVTAAGQVYDNVGRLTVLNGADGLQGGMMGAVTTALNMLPVVTSAMKGITSGTVGDSDGDHDGNGGGRGVDRPKPGPRGGNDGAGKPDSGEPGAGTGTAHHGDLTPLGAGAGGGVSASEDLEVELPQIEMPKAKFDVPAADSYVKASERAVEATGVHMEGAAEAAAHVFDEVDGYVDEFAEDADEYMDRAEGMADQIFDVADDALHRTQTMQGRINELRGRMQHVRGR